jgi:Replication initiator protein A
MPYRPGEQTVLPLSDLHPDKPDAVGYLERSIASSPVWQMGPKAPERDVARRDPRLLDFLASAKNAPLGELEFDVLTWTITRWYQLGRPSTGRLSASFGEIAHALYGQRQGGKQYALIRQALDHLYSVSLDLTVLSIDDGNERWQTSRRRRIIQELTVRERIAAGAEHGTNTIELQLGSWLVDQLDAHTVAAIAWHVLRGLTGIAKRLAIYLAAHSGDFRPITQHTERFTVALTDDLYEEFGITAARERDRRGSVARAAERIAGQDPRYSKLLVERAGDRHLLRAERPRGGDPLILPSAFSGAVARGAGGP